MAQPRKRPILTGSCPHSRLGHTSDIHSHSYSNSDSPTQQHTSLTSPAGMIYTFSFSFVFVCLVIIDPVQQEDAQLSRPLCQASAVPVTVWCSGVAILCAVMYLMVWRFALNYEGTTTVHTRLGTVICYQLTCTSGGVPSQCASRRLLNVFTVLLLTTSYGNNIYLSIIKTFRPKGKVNLVELL